MLLLRFTLAYMHLVLPSHFFIVVYAFCTVIQFSWVRPMRRTSFYELFAFDEIVNMNHKPTNKPSSTEQSFGTRITTVVFYVKKKEFFDVIYKKKVLDFVFHGKPMSIFPLFWRFFSIFPSVFSKKEIDFSVQHIIHFKWWWFEMIRLAMKLKLMPYDCD